MVQWSHDKVMLSERRAVSKPSRNKNVQDLSLYLDVNGERLQNSTTRNMIFTVPHIVWYCSQFFILEPGRPNHHGHSARRWARNEAAISLVDRDVQ